MEGATNCRTCKEEIKEGATWCPHCSRPQSVLRAVFPPQAIVLFIIGFVGYWFVTFQAMEDSFDQFSNEPIYEAASVINVSDINIQFNNSGCETCVTTTGKLENTSDQAYADLHFQVTYFDSENNTIDVVNDSDNDLIIGPKSEGAFRVKAKAATDVSKYIKSEVKITKAKPDSSWY